MSTRTLVHYVAIGSVTLWAIAIVAGAALEQDASAHVAAIGRDVLSVAVLVFVTVVIACGVFIVGSIAWGWHEEWTEERRNR